MSTKDEVQTCEPRSLTHAEKKLLDLKEEPYKTLLPEGEDEIWSYEVQEKYTNTQFKITMLDESSIYDDNYWIHYLLRTDDNKIFWIKSHIHMEAFEDHNAQYDEIGECLKDGMFTDYWSIQVSPKPYQMKNQKFHSPDLFKALAFWLYYHERSSFLRQEVSDYFEDHSISDKFSFSFVHKEK